jgi:hypothetical protein
MRTLLAVGWLVLIPVSSCTGNELSGRSELMTGYLGDRLAVTLTIEL